MAKKQFLLRIDYDLYTQIEAYAKRQHLSVNSSITTLLSQSIEREGSLEQRRFVGLTVDGSQITPEHNLIEVKGIYYRFVIINNSIPDLNHQYLISNVQDNVLILTDLSLSNAL
ncbi:Arc family DNA-binding protein [Periweissella fabalis]|uniref:Arc family DNA-binding protein n=1 Tax=Periweissella fabalis TaxID=1070421 RepID=A0A7X6MZT8_9LACO|nr:Arc family DNA-binding protein [Periweissella fabalis]MCM0598923.1 Arc family DNA-binding protein [Periweissella fabalis]NKZ23203.1 Arc family DNA-binding protein [Periweissella fabalis]